jgi:hypothetical protein
MVNLLILLVLFLTSCAGETGKNNDNDGPLTINRDIYTEQGKTVETTEENSEADEETCDETHDEEENNPYEGPEVLVLAVERSVVYPFPSNDLDIEAEADKSVTSGEFISNYRYVLTWVYGEKAPRNCNAENVKEINDLGLFFPNYFESKVVSLRVCVLDLETGYYSNGKTKTVDFRK